MSYDLEFMLPTGPSLEDWEQSGWSGLSPTYNLYPMFREALGGDGLHELHGKWVQDIKPLLELGIQRMKSDPDKYCAMNPSNGWGDSKGALWVLEELRRRIDLQHPWARLQVS